MGYFSIVPTNVAPSELPKKIRAGYTVPIPGYLISKLALSRELQGKGFGTFLLLDALETIAAAANLGGGRLAVVDAIDEVAFSFYQRFGLRPIGESERLYLRIDEIRESLAVAKYGSSPLQTKALAANFRWALSGPPEHLLILQFEPIEHTLRNRSRPYELMTTKLREVGFQKISSVSNVDDLDPASHEICCRIDSSNHATIISLLDPAETFEVSIPHDRPGFNVKITNEGKVTVIVTTDSIGQDGLLDRSMFARDVAAGSVIGARVDVVRS